jgi:hypothetical protein
MAGGAAIWRSAGKASEVRRDNKTFESRMRDAVNLGDSSVKVPERMLSLNNQRGELTTFMAKLTGGVFLAGAVAMAVFGAAPLITATTPGIAALGTFGGAAALAAGGLASIHVANKATDARDYAHSKEAAVLREEIANERARGPMPEPAPAPAVDLPKETPLSDHVRLQQEAYSYHRAANSPSHVERLLQEQAAESARSR